MSAHGGNLQLIGEVDTRDDLIIDLQRENVRLKCEVRDLKAAVAAAKQDSAKAVAKLRHLLTPWHHALAQLFGEMEGIGEVEHASGGSDTDPRKLAAWETWKRKLGGKRADFIQALLEHGEMTPIQLKVTTHSGTSTVGLVLKQLSDLGLVTKNGSKYSLREI